MSVSVPRGATTMVPFTPLVRFLSTPPAPPADVVIVGDPTVGQPGRVLRLVKGKVSPYRDAPGQKPCAGRNQTCPCGSGKKSKRCCRGPE